MASLVNITTEDEMKLSAAEDYLKGAQNFIIDSPFSLILATKILQEIKAKKNEFDAMRKKLKKPINEAGKAIEDFFRQPIHFLGQAETEYKVNIIKYEQSITDRNIAIEKNRAAELVRINNQAIEAVKSNNVNEYTDLMMELADLKGPVESVSATDGLGIRDNWKGRVVDIRAYLWACVEGKAPISLLTIDPTALNSLARSVRDTVTYPGVEFYNDKIVSVKVAK